MKSLYETLTNFKPARSERRFLKVKAKDGEKSRNQAAGDENLHLCWLSASFFFFF